MIYRVVLVTEKNTGCNPKSITGEIEKECNRWSNQGFVLVTAYQQSANAGCNGSAVGAVLIFAKQKDTQ